MLFEAGLFAETALAFHSALTHPKPQGRRPSKLSRPAQLAVDMLRRDWKGQLPVDIHAMCEASRVPVHTAAIAEEGVAAQLHWNQEGTNARIVVNDALSREVQRFAIAQALGSILMHHSSVRMVALSGPSASSAPELEANVFALQVLMPTHGLAEITARYRTEAAVAAVYDVAPRKAMTRLLAQSLSKAR